MKLLFFSVTKHQYRYFEILRKSLDTKSKHLFFPSLSFSFKGFFYTKQLQLDEIFAIKFKEIDTKYANLVTRYLYKALLKLQAPWIVSSIYANLHALHPDYLIVWNGKKFHQAIAVRIAQKMNIQPVFFENGLLPKTTTMDFHGVNASNSVPRERTFFENLHYDENLTLPSSLQIRQSKVKKKEFITDLPEKYVFVPFQVAYDTQIIQHSPWIPNMFVLFEMIEWFSSKLDLHFVIKEHPSDKVSDYDTLHKKISDKIHFSSQSTQILIENAACVMTINSSVAMESLLFSKRVIVLGEAFFAIDGIVKTAKNKEDVMNILYTLEKWKVNEKLIKNFLLYLNYEYLIPGDWRTPDEKHLNMIKKRLEDAV